MPTYSYRCTACDHAFDIQQAFTDDSLTQCPHCSKELRKVFSSIGVTFQGSGFYQTDSRAEAKASKASSGDKKKAPEKKSEPASTAAVSGSSSTTKPAASKPAKT
jgi:putative FmdB family regulatory protein